MRFEEVKLFSNELQKQKAFYENQLNIATTTCSPSHFTVKIGDSTLSFYQSDKKYIYHYCFLIPSNQLVNAISWLKDRVQLVKLENDNYIQHFESWNADSIYFLDGNNNIAELIVRHQLSNDREGLFDQSHLINFNEMGMPSKDVEKHNNYIEEKTGSKFWKGDLKRFATNGDLEGIILIPNYNVKKTWFPTSIPIEAAPFECKIKINQKSYFINYHLEELTIDSL